ncbi:hypothetical protein C8J56DRAFT_948277 [Mycena floridula]|nr:hypothetical protein C8J56DRAFT_948277 [Mycena floridula]
MQRIRYLGREQYNSCRTICDGTMGVLIPVGHRHFHSDIARYLRLSPHVFPDYPQRSEGRRPGFNIRCLSSSRNIQIGNIQWRHHLTTNFQQYLRCVASINSKNDNKGYYKQPRYNDSRGYTVQPNWVNYDVGIRCTWDEFVFMPDRLEPETIILPRSARHSGYCQVLYEINVRSVKLNIFHSTAAKDEGSNSRKSSTKMIIALTVGLGCIGILTISLFILLRWRRRRPAVSALTPLVMPFTETGNTSVTVVSTVATAQGVIDADLVNHPYEGSPTETKFSSPPPSYF